MICCAWDYVRTKEEQLAEKNEAVARATRNLALIKAKVDADNGSLDTRIVTRVEEGEVHALRQQQVRREAHHARVPDSRRLH